MPGRSNGLLDGIVGVSPLPQNGESQGRHQHPKGHEDDPDHEPLAGVGDYSTTTSYFTNPQNHKCPAEYEPRGENEQGHTHLVPDLGARAS